jgi:DNA invertase Pin-like site-specific DNA recombinase
MINSNLNGNAQRFAISSKIQSQHLDRLAIVYVRQSTMQQVAEHQESTRLQYALTDKAYQMGWPKSNIQVIDKDLGCSGSSIDGRLGFQELMSLVALGKVGIVLGREVSRLARSSLDWQRLLETCAIFATLIGDQDGIYDPTLYNDRLLLGLKGSMSEAELHILKQRMLDGRWAKAQRGELVVPVPRGYITTANGNVVKDPDEQVRLVIETIFDVFEYRLSVNGVLKYLVEHEIQLPLRISTGEQKGELEWTRPSRVAIDSVLHNPIYAGAYTYGKKRMDPRKKVPGHRYSGIVRLPIEQWEVLIKDKFPAYISWAQFESNREQISRNQPKRQGPTRQGQSLLAGLLYCPKCGIKMSTDYGNNGHGLRYLCNKKAINYAEPYCQTIVGSALDEFVQQLVFEALEPAALEISLQVASNIKQEHERLNLHWSQRLERAIIDTERAYRQYNAVEPENRLVARTLEKQWEESLLQEEKLKQEFEEFQAKQPVLFGEQEQEQIRQMAHNIPAIWAAKTTQPADRQQIVRLLIEQVIVDVQNHSEKINLVVNWHGGHKTETSMIRPVAHFDQLSCYDDLLKRVKAEYEQGKSKAQIAKMLNDEHWPTPRIVSKYRVKTVTNLLLRIGIESETGVSRFADEIERTVDEWTVNELSNKIGVATNTIGQWIKKGKLKARKIELRGFKVWLIKASETELDSIKRAKKPKTSIKTDLRRHYE